MLEDLANIAEANPPLGTTSVWENFLQQRRGLSRPLVLHGMVLKSPVILRTVPPRCIALGCVEVSLRKGILDQQIFHSE